MNIRSIAKISDLLGKTVMVRVDFNVPMKSGKLLDDFKVQKSIPTIKFLLSKGANVILVSHLGRPTRFDKNLSLRPLVPVLQHLLGVKVGFSELNDFEMIAGVRVTLLENIRFYTGEEKNDPKFAERLAGLADMFVLDGFAVAHRQSASVCGVANFLPTFAGLLLAEEISGLSAIMDRPKKPLVVLLGGSKVETKIPLLKYFLSAADYILVGGGVSNTYFWAKGKKMGDSVIDKAMKKEILFCGNHKKVIFPVDLVVGSVKGKKAHVVSVNQLNLKKGFGAYDVGPETVRLFSKYIKNANTLVWNGAFGMFEVSPYQHGTYAIANLISARSRGKAFGVCGGGETVEILRKLNLADNIDLVSTGGGAMLEFLSGAKLPGLQVFNK